MGKPRSRRELEERILWVNTAPWDRTADGPRNIARLARKCGVGTTEYMATAWRMREEGRL